jgi:hypothetical protein
MFERILDYVAAHQGVVAASATSTLGTLGLAAGAVPVPTQAPDWLPYAVSVFGPAITIVIHRTLAAFGAGYKARAESRRRRAEQLRKDSDPTNDAEAARLEDEAAADAARGAALDRLGEGK